MDASEASRISECVTIDLVMLMSILVHLTTLSGLLL